MNFLRRLVLALITLALTFPPCFAANQSGVFNVQILTSTGAPAANYRLYTYTAGTTTHKAAYTDSAAGTPHTYTSDGAGGQYIALDSRGELPAPLFLTTGAYDLTLKTPAGSTVWTRRTDNIPASSPTLSGDGTVSAPAYSFSADANTGMWRPSADVLGFAVGGNDALRITATGTIAVQGANDLSVYTNGTDRFHITSDGRIYGKAVHNNAGAVTGTTNQYFASGTYTPTAAASSNVTTATGQAAQWTRVGNVVTVSGGVTIDPTNVSTQTSITLTLPIASTFTVIYDANGTASVRGPASAAQSMTGEVEASGSTAVLVFWCGTDASSLVWKYTYQYEVK